jgi:hypothetical protein
MGIVSWRRVVYCAVTAPAVCECEYCAAAFVDAVFHPLLAIEHGPGSALVLCDAEVRWLALGEGKLLRRYCIDHLSRANGLREGDDNEEKRVKSRVREDERVIRWKGKEGG